MENVVHAWPEANGCLWMLEASGSSAVCFVWTGVESIFAASASEENCNHRQKQTHMQGIILASMSDQANLNMAVRAHTQEVAQERLAHEVTQTQHLLPFRAAAWARLPFPTIGILKSSVTRIYSSSSASPFSSSSSSSSSSSGASLEA